MLATTEGIDAVTRYYSHDEVQAIVAHHQASIAGLTNLLTVLVRRLAGSTLVTGLELSELERCVLHTRKDVEANGVRVWVTREGDPNAPARTVKLILPPGVTP